MMPATGNGGGARYELRESLALAFVAALQGLPPRRRAVLLLHDVLGFEAEDVAEILDAGAGWVEDELRLARRGLEARLPPSGRPPPPLPGSPQEARVVGRFAEAFERGDSAALGALLTAGTRLTWPPEPLDRFRLLPTRANMQPAFGCYIRDLQDRVARAYGLMVLTLEGERISAIAAFPDAGLFARFGLPRTVSGPPAYPR